MSTQKSISPKNCSSALASSLLAVVLMLSTIIACRSSSSDSKAPCIGSVVYEGQTFTGQAGNVEDAQKFACNNYVSMPTRSSMRTMASGWNLLRAKPPVARRRRRQFTKTKICLVT